MALLERVATLLRANLNDLIDRAENPETMLKQLMLDMENQLLQVKTQVAIAIADQHLLQRKRDAHRQGAAEWNRKAALALSRHREDLAKEALARSLTETRSEEAFAQQVDDQCSHTETLRSQYLKLQHRLAETRTRFESLRATGLRAAVVHRAHAAAVPLPQGAMDRYAERVARQAAMNHAHTVLHTPDAADTLRDMERDEQVNALLEELKNRRALTA